MQVHSLPTPTVVRVTDWDLFGTEVGVYESVDSLLRTGADPVFRSDD